MEYSLIVEKSNNDKLNVSDVVNNLTTTASGKALDARQGKVLNDSNRIIYSGSYVSGSTYLKNGSMVIAFCHHPTYGWGVICPSLPLTSTGHDFGGATGIVGSTPSGVVLKWNKTNGTLSVGGEFSQIRYVIVFK